MSLQGLSAEDRLLWADLPSVSVVVLNYNAGEHLEACFRSLQQLLYPEDRLEIILVDNASDDGSLAYMQANFGWVKLIRNDQNYGFSKGNNLGAREARGHLVAFLNPDMRVDKRWLLELVKPLLVDREAAAVGSQILSWDGQTIDFAGSAANFYGYGYQVGTGQPAGKHLDGVQPVLATCGGAMIVRRQVFLEAGGFDEDFFAFYEDLDLGWRLWILGYKVLFAPASIVYHHHHGSWGKVADEKRRVLYERNAFFTMLKNYEQENLDRILPVALLLLLKRIYLAAGIDERVFRAEPDLSKGKKEAGSAKTRRSEAILSTPGYGPGYYFKRGWQTLIREGAGRLYLKTKAEIKQRLLTWLRRQRPGPMWIDQRWPQQAIVPLQALSYIVAGNDIIMLYDKMLNKRHLIQARRHRSDQEIFHLFGRPFAFSELWPEYQQTQIHLSQLFELDKLFTG